MFAGLYHFIAYMYVKISQLQNTMSLIFKLCLVLLLFDNLNIFEVMDI